jgi:dihydroorotase-like cyclic amidohydrolase
MIPLLLTAAHAGKLTYSDIITRCVTNPIQIFALESKGALELGKDADIVLVDPGQEYVLTDEQMLSKSGWTPFAGMRMKGKIQRVYLRGTLAYEQGICLGSPGSGKMLRYHP